MQSKSHQQIPAARITALLLVGSGLLVLGIAGIVLLSTAGARNPASGEASAAPARVDMVVPAVELSDLQGNPVALQRLNGQVILVNNWATWCPPCTAEMPVLQDYYEDHRGQNFTLVAINSGESIEQVQAFVQERGLSLPVWVDPEEKTMDALNEIRLPSSFVIDASGRVVLYWAGAISREMLEKHVTPLLEN